MAKISLPTAISGYNLQVINDNFSAIATEFQTKVLYRDNPTGEPNQMENALDMNSNNILNTRQIDTQLLKINGVFISPENPAVIPAALNTFEYTATASQTTFSVSPFTPALASIQVIVDGLQLPLSDISVSGTSIITPAQLAGAEVMVRMYTQQPTVGVDASVVTYVPEGAGAETTTVQTKLRESVSVKDFGAVGDGVTDDSVPFGLFIDHCAASGSAGYIPPGTYLVDPFTKTFVGSQPFTLFGAGRKETVLKSSNTGGGFFSFSGGNNIVLRDLTVDGSFTGSPATPTAGATIATINANNISFIDIDIINVWRVGILAYNDHQTVLTNVYSGFLADGVRVYGPTNYIKDVGPSALLVADYDYSTMRNCYIENIGQYGYEFKNDSNYTAISNCVAVNTYKGVYYGGDGPQVARRYVKNSTVSDCTLVDCDNPMFIGLADSNLFTDIKTITTNGAVLDASRAEIAIQDSNNNIFNNIHISNRRGYACDIRDVSSGNIVKFTLSDGVFKGEAIAVNSDSTPNSLEIAGKNHDVVVLNSLRFLGACRVVDVQAKYEYNVTSEANPRIENSLSATRPPVTSTAKGLVQFGETFDTYTNSNTASLYENFGNYTTGVLSQVRHRFDTGAKTETIWAVGGASSVVFSKDQNGFSPGADNTLRLGALSARWNNLYCVNIRPGVGLNIWTSGAGSPEGAVSAVVGSLYTNTTGGALTTLYVKETGTGNTGWVAK
jgi:hypothetical protein